MKTKYNIGAKREAINKAKAELKASRRARKLAVRQEKYNKAFTHVIETQCSLSQAALDFGVSSANVRLWVFGYCNQANRQAFDSARNDKGRPPSIAWIRKHSDLFKK
jgi:hypothetical protein